jgi:hypothetical protein
MHHPQGEAVFRSRRFSADVELTHDELPLVLAREVRTGGRPSVFVRLQAPDDAIFGRKFERQFKRRDESNVNANARNRRLLAQNRRFSGPNSN